MLRCESEAADSVGPGVLRVVIDINRVIPVDRYAERCEFALGSFERLACPGFGARKAAQALDVGEVNLRKVGLLSRNRIHSHPASATSRSYLALSWLTTPPPPRRGQV